MTERIGVDAPRITQDEAERFMAHHLSLAAMYFEATGSDLKDRTSDVFGDVHEGAKAAAEAFLRSLDEYYRNLD